MFRNGYALVAWIRFDKDLYRPIEILLTLHEEKIAERDEMENPLEH